MRSTSKTEVLARLAFAERAAEVFKGNAESATYGDLTPGGYFALRWGLCDNCVLVLKLDDCDEPVNYHNLVNESKG